MNKLGGMLSGALKSGLDPKQMLGSLMNDNKSDAQWLANKGVENNVVSKDEANAGLADPNQALGLLKKLKQKFGPDGLQKAVGMVRKAGQEQIAQKLETYVTPIWAML